MWRSVAFRGTEIKLRIGESTSSSTKFDRIINEVEFGETSSYISGRKVDLIVETTSVNTKNMPITIELSNAEFKKMDVDDDCVTIQRNKNIRTSKSILSSIFALNSDEAVIGFCRLLWLFVQRAISFRRRFHYQRSRCLPAWWCCGFRWVHEWMQRSIWNNFQIQKLHCEASKGYRSKVPCFA